MNDNPEDRLTICYACAVEMPASDAHEGIGEWEGEVICFSCLLTERLRMAEEESDE